MYVAFVKTLLTYFSKNLKAYFKKKKKNKMVKFLSIKYKTF